MLTAKVKDIADADDRTTFTFEIPKVRGATDGGIVTVRERRYTAEYGQLTTDDLEPGPAVLHISGGGGGSFTITIPDSETPVQLASLLDATTEYPEPVVAAAQAARNEAISMAAIAGAAATISTDKAEDAADSAAAAAVSAQQAADTAATGVPDATSSGKGKIQLAGDLGGTADAPTVPALQTKADLVDGVIPQAQIPAIALTDFLGTVASQSAMLALSGQRGDWCTRTDRGTDWQLIAEPSTILTNWRERTYPASPVSSVAGRTGAVTLSTADVTDMSSVGASLAKAADKAAARSAIDAGTSSLQIGTTASTAMAGNRIQLVADLPATGVEGVLYLKPRT
ncbi:hypothetical protein [Rhodococcus sp. 2G]|uniref:hypothetical protein n=1 Tax=Rhodococcus sp. 2G TaxID=1570939 RepID=UPI0007DA4763|nr:hypothetical protein [Rhodococcus sp. 2G]